MPLSYHPCHKEGQAVTTTVLMSVRPHHIIIIIMPLPSLPPAPPPTATITNIITITTTPAKVAFASAH